MPDHEGQIAAAFRALAPRVALLLMRRYGLTMDDALDAVQNVFTSLLAQEQRFESYEPAHLRNYIIRAAHSRALDATRRELRFRKHEDVLLSALLLDTGPTIETRMVDDERRRALREGIGTLGEPYASIFKLLIYEELSLAEIAERLNISLGSIYTQYSRGVEKLRSMLRTK